MEILNSALHTRMVRACFAFALLCSVFLCLLCLAKAKHSQAPIDGRGAILNLRAGVHGIPHLEGMCLAHTAVWT